MRDFKFRSLFSSRISSLASRSILAIAALSCIASTAQAQIPGAKIYAEYNIHFAGFNLGLLKFQSSTNGKTYTMKGETEVSLLGGLIYKWRGKTSARGTYKGSKITPKRFDFKFSDSKKAGSIKMKFTDGQVSSLKIAPYKAPSSRAIPVTRSHMTNVYDPFSALLAFTSTGRGFKSVCNKVIPIFDGKMRFDLKLSYKKSARINQSSTGGYSGRLTVCKVKYIPVAGHKPTKKEVKFMAKNNGVEVWLMPLPRSRMYVPYQIIVPTPYGKGRLVSSFFQIKQYGRPKLALVQ